MPVRQLHLLLVEDDDIDAEVVVRNFRPYADWLTVTRARDGLEALTRLRDHDGQHRLAQPYLILTDLNMPRMNGIEFLRELRRDPQLRHAVVLVLTSSALDEDMRAVYEQRIAGYILKERIAQNFSALVQVVEGYHALNHFPPETRRIFFP